MRILTPPAFEKKAHHEDDLWVRRECYRFYVQQRRKHCTLTQRLDLWLLAPVCTDCMQSDVFESQREPGIKPATWEEDLLVEVGKETLAETQLQLLKNPDYAFACKKCGCQLRPWNGHEMHIVSYHLEEHYGIDLETPGRTWPSRKLRNQILALYDSRCFACPQETGLHIDHIQPRACDGDAAFRNLQPLCEVCGQRKGDSPASEITVLSTIYFGLQPSDGYEGLFW